MGGITEKIVILQVLSMTQTSGLKTKNTVTKDLRLSPILNHKVVPLFTTSEEKTVERDVEPKVKTHGKGTR